MCDEPATAENLRAATPHPVPGSAVDPITLKPEDGIVVTTLVDNVYDALLGRTGFRRRKLARSVQCVSPLTCDRCNAWGAAHPFLGARR